jgi:hypothetical protein
MLKSGVQQIMHSRKKDVVTSIKRNFYVFVLGLFKDTSNAIKWKGMWNKTAVVKREVPSQHLPEDAEITKHCRQDGRSQRFEPRFEAGSY